MFTLLFFNLSAPDLTTKAMKYIIAIILPILLSLSATARVPHPEKEGIQFFEGSWSQALQRAREEKKPIFLDISASWCGPCKMLKHKTFTNRNVAEYFNTYFINVLVDGEEGEGQMLADRYRIQAYPSLFILDDKGEVMNFGMGYMSPKELIHFAENLARRRE